MRKTKLKIGRHPMVMKNRRLFNKINRIIYEYDPQARLVPTRFYKKRGSPREPELVLNSSNPKELFLKIVEKQAVQRFKIECSSDNAALRLLNNLDFGEE